MWLFPERAKERKNLQKFLGMIKDVIAEKKKIVAENAKMEIKGERDLITMMLEVPEEDVLTDEELVVCIEKRRAEKGARFICSSVFIIFRPMLISFSLLVMKLLPTLLHLLFIVSLLIRYLSLFYLLTK